MMQEAFSAAYALGGEEQAVLAHYAVQSIEYALARGAQLDTSSLAKPDNAVLHAQNGAFVTLTRAGRLRGCIGTIIGREALYKTVSAMAYAAAFRDVRFSSLMLPEWAGTALEISVLSEPTHCANAAHIEVGRHGLLLMLAEKNGVFLPQVPVEQGWGRTEYLEALCVKAGLPSRSWEHPAARLFWFEAYVFPARMP